MKPEDIIFKGIKKVYYSKGVRKFLKICIIIFIVYCIYSTGRMRGYVEGVSGALAKHNDTVCNLLGRERYDNGFCALKNETSEYRYYIDCGWEKFELRGEKEPTFLMKMSSGLQRTILYPITGC